MEVAKTPYVYKLRDNDTLETQGFISAETKLSLDQQRLFRTLLINAKAYSGSCTQAIKTAINQFNASCPNTKIKEHDPGIQAIIEF